MSLSLKTSRCIVTGLPAITWCGHLTARGYGPIRDDGRMPLLTVGVLAGFSSTEVYLAAQSDGRGFYGEWKREHGLVLSSVFGEDDRHIEAVSGGRSVIADTSLIRELVESNRRQKPT